MDAISQKSAAALTIQSWYRKFSKTRPQQTALTPMQVKALTSARSPDRELPHPHLTKNSEDTPFQNRFYNCFSPQPAISQSYTLPNQKRAIKNAIDARLLCLKTKVVRATNEVLFAGIGEPLRSTVYIVAVYALMKSGFHFPNIRLEKNSLNTQGVGTFVKLCYGALTKHNLKIRKKFNECLLGALLSSVIQQNKNQDQIRRKEEFREELQPLKRFIGGGEGRYVPPHRKASTAEKVDTRLPAKPPKDITFPSDFFVDALPDFLKVCEMAIVVIYREGVANFTNFTLHGVRYLGTHSNKIIQECNSILALLSPEENDKFKRSPIGELFNDLNNKFLKDMEKYSQ